MSISVEVLQRAFDADPNAIHALVVNRVPCNQSLADDPYAVVEAARVLPQTHWQVGALGLVNAVLAANGLPLVAAKFSEPAEDGSRQMAGFCEYNPVGAGDE